MFLSKKTATLNNKNKVKTNVQKPLGGWGDDDDNTDNN